VTNVAPTLYSYWRSSASYRVRLALAWKRLEHRIIPIDLREDEQSADEFRALNPQGMVPLFVAGGGAPGQEVALAQSLAIIEYLEDEHPAPPLLPADSVGRALVRGAAQIIACDTHPLNNLRVLRYLKDPLGHSQLEVDAWARHWIDSGLGALEYFASRHRGRYLYGNNVSVADICLLPQLYNARRVESDLSGLTDLLEIEANLLDLEIFAPAHPEWKSTIG
jgi:maleylacetoacetate isomerase